MKRNLIFDASVLVTAYLSGNIYATGVYRVSYEILCRLTQYENYTIYLFDIYRRERELRKFIAPKFKQVQVLPVDSKLYKTFVYPLFNLADHFRIKEYQSYGISLKFFYRFCKNCFQTLGRGFRYLEKKRTIPANFLKFNNSDIYFSTYNTIPLNVSFLLKLRKAIIIHDMIPIMHPEYFYDYENRQILEIIIKSISDNDIVICVSKSTKRDFLDYRPSFNPDNVFVSHLAGAVCFRPISSIKQVKSVKEKYNIPDHKNYFLSVGTIEPRKNIGLLISAYERLLKTLHENELPLLILTGEIGWKVQILLDKINSINKDFPNSIILTGFVTDEELSVLYSSTSAFVYPSLYEGFGLPPLEAMQCGAPVITSNNSSLPEVVGSAGILIDAKNEDAMLEALITCLDIEKTNEMRKRSLQRSALFSWDKTVKNIVNILN
jgi:glycosyltransferase involved in cell wall biosynthesis